jgi:2-dehydropantoate 2-reductase
VDHGGRSWRTIGDKIDVFYLVSVVQQSTRLPVLGPAAGPNSSSTQRETSVTLERHPSEPAPLLSGGMEIVVVGAGAMGAAMGGLLADGGAEVTLVDIDTQHMDAIAAHGLVLRHTDGREQRLHPAATHDASSVGRADFVLVMTKSWATTAAVESVRHAIGPETWVASAQNGLGNDRRIRDAGVEPSRVMGGTTTVGATYVEPGVVAVSGTVTEATSLTQFGLAPGVLRPAVAGDFEDAFAAAEMPLEVLDDLEVVLWTKLCMAGTAGCLTAAAGITIGDMVDSPELMATWQLMLDEVLAVADAEGVVLDHDAVIDHAMTTYRTVGRHWASMAVDVRERRRTEIDAMCVEISTRGRSHHIPTPLNDTVGAMVKAIERSWSSTD